MTPITRVTRPLTRALLLCAMLPLMTGCATSLQRGPLAGSSIQTDGRSTTVAGRTRVRTAQGAGCTVGTRTRVGRTASPTTATMSCSGIRLGR